MRCGRGLVPEPMRIQREGAQLQIRGTWSAGPGDDQARFLADMRALRDSAAIGYDELSARAHYPSDVLKEAENGPSLPGLPILSAYVRACEGDVLDWEERWRRLNSEVPDDPDLPVRPAGASAAAVAGARAGVGVAPPDVYDPDRIRAALRGDPGRAGQSDRRDNDPGVLAPAVADDQPGPQPGYDQPAEPDTNVDRGVNWGASTGWDAAPEPHVTSANGSHAAAQAARGPFDAAFPSTPDTAADSQAEDFSWMKENPPQSAPGENEPSSWSAPAENEPSWRSALDEPSSWSARADSGLASLPEPGRAARREGARSPISPSAYRATRPRAWRHRSGPISGPSRRRRLRPRLTCGRPRSRAPRSRRSPGLPGPPAPRRPLVRPWNPRNASRPRAERHRRLRWAPAPSHRARRRSARQRPARRCQRVSRPTPADRIGTSRSAS